MLLHPGVSGTTGPSSVALTTLAGNAVCVHCLQSQVIAYKLKEIRNLPQWEANRLDVEPRHHPARAEA
jgi:hypothetical protein